MNSDQLQNIIVAWNKCCESTAEKLNTTHDNLDEWLIAIEECCEVVNANADEIIELLEDWASEYSATYTDYQCGLVDNELTTTTTTLPVTTTTLPVTTTTTTIDPDLIEWEIVFSNFLCQQEFDPTAITTTTIPLKSGTIVFEAEYTNYLCEKVDNPLITTTTTTISGTTTTTTTVDPEDVTFTATYENYLCEKVNNPLFQTTTTTTTINEDDITWEIVFENFLCQQVSFTTTTTTESPTTTTTTTVSTNCGIEIIGEKVYPEIHHIDLGSGIGLVSLTIDAMAAPDKFTVDWNGSEVINTGYHGDTSFQDELYTALAAEGAIPEAIVGGSTGVFYFNKTTADQIATVTVYAPIDETKWNFTLSCPGVTTTTIDPELEAYEATYTDYLCAKVDNPSITTTTTTTAPTTTTTTVPVTTTTTTIPVFGINCGDPASGGVAYPMEIYITEMGAGTGYVTLNYDAESIPDKFIVEIDGLEVLNTGYVGDSALQSSLNAALIALGEPPETIQGSGVGSATFFKSSSTTIAVVKVFAPMSETAWEFTLSCPDGGTTTTSTTAVATTTTTTIAPTTTTTTTNAPPVSTNNSVTNERTIGNCGKTLILTPSDFTFTDAEGDALNYVKITSYALYGLGTLTYKGNVVDSGDTMKVFGGSLGSFQHTMEYTPDPSNGGAYSDAIEFLVKTKNSNTYG